jgi:hypothetical protein
MGRRSRARARAAEPATAPPPSGPATSAPAGRRRSLLQLLNPFKLRPPSRTRVRYAAAGFGLSAVLFAALGWLTGEPSWFNSAVLLAILALAWGVRAALMRGTDRSS